MRRREFLETLAAAQLLGANLRAAEERPRIVSDKGSVTLDNGRIRRVMDTGGAGLRLLALQNARSGFDWAARGAPAGTYLAEGRNHWIGLGAHSGFRFSRKTEQELPGGRLECRLEYVRENRPQNCL